MWFKRFTAKAEHGLTLAAALERLAMIERAVEIQLHDKHQAAVNSQEATTIANLIHAMEATPAACLRFGNYVILKFERDGKPEVHARQLSPTEVRAVERYPDLHRKPETFFQSLNDIVNLPGLEDPNNDDSGPG